MSNTKSIDLNGSTQSLSSTSTDFLFGTGDFSIVFWFKTSTTSSSVLVGKHRNAGNANAYTVWINAYGGTGYVSFTFQQGTDDEPGQARAISTTSGLNDGAWHHVAAVRDGNTARLYIDGSLEHSDTSSGTPNTDDGSADFCIGSRDLAIQYYDGLIDEVSVWDDARSGTEVSDSYNSGDGEILVGNETNLIAYYRLEDDVLDETANNNDLTNNNSASFSTDVPFTGASGSPDRMMLLGVS